MKKILSLASVLALGVLLTACGSGKTASTTYVGEENGAKAEITLSHSSDSLKKMEQKMEMPFSDMGVEVSKLDDATKKQLTEMVEAQYNEYAKGNGVELKTEFKEDALTVMTAIDLEKVDAKQVSSLLKGTSDPKKVSFKETVKDLEARGFKEKK